jgi:hypothetical protein
VIRRAPAVIQPPNAADDTPVPGNGAFDERLGAALAGAEVPPPAQVPDGDLINAFHRA